MIHRLSVGKQLNMLRNIIQAVFLAIILTSCQREVSIIQRVNDDPLLVKIISVSASQNDSTIVTYEYDSDQRLIRQTHYNRYPATGPVMLPSWQEFTRDALGRVTQIKGVGRSVMNPTVEITSTYTVYYINDTSTRVDYISNDNNDHRKEYQYNNAGQIVRTEDYQRLPSTAPLRMVVYHLFQYDAAGNIIEMKEFTDHDNNGSFDYNIGANFEYDGKINPQYHRRDDVFFQAWGGPAPQNSVKMFVNNPHPLSIQDTVSTQFTYRSDDRPQTATVSGNSISQSFRTYFYQ